MPILRDKRTFVLAAQFIVTYHMSILSPHIIKAIESLSLIADTDDYKTYPNQYIRDVNDARIMLALRQTCIDKYLPSVSDKRVVRPLIDSIDRSKRLYRIR